MIAGPEDIRGNGLLAMISDDNSSAGKCNQAFPTTFVSSPEFTTGDIFDTFPKVEPFIWWDKAYSGVTPYLIGFDIWNWESGLYEEHWTITEITSGSWVGYEAKATLQHSPGIKGLEATMRYLLLPGSQSFG